MTRTPRVWFPLFCALALFAPPYVSQLLACAVVLIVALYFLVWCLAQLPKVLEPVARVFGVLTGFSLFRWAAGETDLSRYILCGLSVLAILLALTPRNAKSAQRFMADLALRLGWSLVIYGFYERGIDSLLLGFIVLMICGFELRKWQTKGTVPFVSWIEAASRWAESFLRPKPNAFRSNRATLRTVRALEKRVILLARNRWISTHRKIESIYRLTERFSGQALAWQVAYWVALRQEDYLRAANLAVDARKAGHLQAFGDHQLGMALWGAQDPMGKAVLNRAGYSFQQAVDTDPTLAWTKADVRFRRLQEAVAEGFLPQSAG